jgi:hypothetical protein
MNKMDAIKRNRILMWVAIILLSGNIAMVSAILINGKSKYKNNYKSERYRDGKRGEFESRMANELKLDANQIEKYKELKKAHKLKMIPLQDSIKKTKWMIHQEILKEEVDRNYINQLSDSIGQLNAQFEKLNYNHFLELKEQLREDQLGDFKKFMECLPYGKESYHKRMGGDFKHRD